MREKRSILCGLHGLAACSQIYLFSSPPFLSFPHPSSLNCSAATMTSHSCKSLLTAQNRAMVFLIAQIVHLLKGPRIWGLCKHVKWNQERLFKNSNRIHNNYASLELELAYNWDRLSCFSALFVKLLLLACFPGFAVWQLHKHRTVQSCSTAKAIVSCTNWWKKKENRACSHTDFKYLL